MKINKCMSWYRFDSNAEVGSNRVQEIKLKKWLKAIYFVG